MQTRIITLLTVAVACFLGCAGEVPFNRDVQNNGPSSVASQTVATEVTPGNVPRVSPKIVRRRVAAGKALLVYVYDNDENFELTKLRGAIPMSRFREILPTLPMDQEIYFYCG